MARTVTSGQPDRSGRPGQDLADDRSHLHSPTRFEALSQYDTITLLQDRASASAPGFAVTADNLEAV